MTFLYLYLLIGLVVMLVLHQLVSHFKIMREHPVGTILVIVSIGLFWPIGLAWLFIPPKGWKG